MTAQIRERAHCPNTADDGGPTNDITKCDDVHPQQLGPRRHQGVAFMSVLAVDVGGTHVKILASGEKDSRKFDSGADMSAQRMVDGVKQIGERLEI